MLGGALADWLIGENQELREGEYNVLGGNDQLGWRVVLATTGRGCFETLGERGRGGVS